MTTWQLAGTGAGVLTPLAAAPASGDLIPMVDVSDTSTAPASVAGSNKTMTVAELVAAVEAAGLTLAAFIAPAVGTLAISGGTVAVNAAVANAWNLAVSGNCTISNPTNPVDGQIIRFRLTSGGSHTVTWGTAYDFGSGSAPTLSTTSSKVDIVAWEYVASISKWCYLGAGIGF